jgi:phenylacetic acid degradation operon negative regulatory protein
MAEAAKPLDDGDLSGLGDAFVLAAAALRHLLADPLLPDELLPDDWPGPSFRADDARFDRTFTAAWRAWYRDQRAVP